MTRLSAYWLLAAVIEAALVAGQASAQPRQLGGPNSAPTLFPAQHARDLKWFHSLDEGIQEAGRSGKPICLILAGRRPAGDC